MNPAEQLKGMELDGGWTVLDIATRKPNATGGHFSCGYIVEHKDGTQGFLKALDYAAAFQTSDPSATLSALTNAYIFEKSVCDRTAHLSRVARAIASGKVHLNPANTFTLVEYLIFELAAGDVRAHLDLLARLDTVFILRTLHNVATGLEQLHRANIAHQDLKPSNVLVFQGRTGSKICDLGRAWDQEQSAPHDAYDIAGDRTYAPIECLYGHVHDHHHARRFGCDMYHLGSLMVFLFTRVHINALLVKNLPHVQHPLVWAGSFHEALPYVQVAFDESLRQFAACVPDFLSADLTQILNELCNPDIARRGHRKNIGGRNQFSLERYISRFMLLADRASIRLARS